MSISVNSKTQRRERRHKKIRTRIFGTANKPRLSVYKSNLYLHVQLIDDEKGITLAGLSSKVSEGRTKQIQAHGAGKILARHAIEKGIKSAVFDRAGFRYIGRVKSFAEGAREGGLEF